MVVEVVAVLNEAVVDLRAEAAHGDELLRVDRPPFAVAFQSLSGVRRALRPLPPHTATGNSSPSRVRALL